MKIILLFILSISFIVDAKETKDTWVLNEKNKNKLPDIALVRIENKKVKSIDFLLMSSSKKQIAESVNRYLKGVAITEKNGFWVYSKNYYLNSKGILSSKTIFTPTTEEVSNKLKVINEGQ